MQGNIIHVSVHFFRKPPRMRRQMMRTHACSQYMTWKVTRLRWNWCGIELQLRHAEPQTLSKGRSPQNDRIQSLGRSCRSRRAHNSRLLQHFFRSENFIRIQILAHPIFYRYTVICLPCLRHRCHPMSQVSS